MSNDRRKVFACDDDPLQLALVEQLLVDMGHEVRTASDGKRAWQVMDAFRPDLIVTDIRMPGLTGIDLLRDIRASDWGRSVPVLVMTGQGRVDRLMMARNSGATDYLLKPFPADRFLARVAALLDPFQDWKISAAA